MFLRSTNYLFLFIYINFLTYFVSTSQFFLVCRFMMLRQVFRSFEGTFFYVFTCIQFIFNVLLVLTFCHALVFDFVCSTFLGLKTYYHFVDVCTCGQGGYERQACVEQIEIKLFFTRQDWFEGVELRMRLVVNNFKQLYSTKA
eukprot:TRINITY_DN2424_c0_g1_i10.p5 TRINITY_DN2424_c0_g1~~TRINITY_DN2424_c0_g1_i10.p5  ORF type:complete len:143 (-),score=2.02 TRINITY_DN2424_c0_g1_i10:47-475(-)